MISTILGLASSALSIWDKKLAVKYQKQLYELQLKRDKILDGESDYDNKIDSNKLDRVDRDIVRLGDLVAAEIARQNA